MKRQEGTGRPKFWIVVELLTGGDIIVLHKMRSVMRLDWNSNLVWHARILAHHHLAKMADSSICTYIFGGKTYLHLPVLFESIVRLSPKCERIGRWSTYDHVDHLKEALDTRSFLDTALDSLEAAGIDPDSSRRRLLSKGEPHSQAFYRVPGQMSESAVLWDDLALDIDQTARGRAGIALTR